MWHKEIPVMLAFDDAQERLVHDAPSPTRTERVSIDGAAGRVLAEPVHALLDLPAADNSAMDGYAIRHADFLAGQGLPVQQRCYAGERPAPLPQGHATRLFTGSLVPEGADQVVSHRMAKKQQMRWTDEGAHCMAQVGVAIFNQEFSPHRVSELEIAASLHGKCICAASPSRHRPTDRAGCATLH
jgi:molybdopterin biosynthesis enzyme